MLPAARPTGSIAAPPELCERITAPVSAPAIPIAKEPGPEHGRSHRWDVHAGYRLGRRGRALPRPRPRAAARRHVEPEQYPRQRSSFRRAAASATACSSAESLGTRATSWGTPLLQLPLWASLDDRGYATADCTLRRPTLAGAGYHGEATAAPAPHDNRVAGWWPMSRAEKRLEVQGPEPGSAKYVEDRAIYDSILATHWHYPKTCAEDNTAVTDALKSLDHMCCSDEAPCYRIGTN